MSLYPDGQDPRRRDRLAAGCVRCLCATTRALHLAGSVVRADCHRLDGPSVDRRPIRRRLLSVRRQTAQSSTSPRSAEGLCRDARASLCNSVGDENVFDIGT